MRAKRFARLKNLGHVVDRRASGDARTGADDAQVVARDVGDREAVRRGRREREREAAGAPARESLPHRVHRGDVESRAEQQLVELRRDRYSFMPRSGAPIRLDAPPESSTIATSSPRRPGVISAIFAAAANEWRPGTGWSPRMRDERRVGRRRAVRSDDDAADDRVQRAKQRRRPRPPPSAARPCRTRRSRCATPRSIGSASIARAVAGRRSARRQPRHHTTLMPALGRARRRRIDGCR